MNDINQAIEEAFYDPNGQQELVKSLENGEYIDPSILEYQKMFPSIANQSDEPISVKKSDVPEYKYEGNDNEASEKPRQNKPNQKERFKKRMLEQDQIIAELKRQNDELTLRTAMTENEKLLTTLKVLEQEKQNLNKIASDAAYQEEYYRSQEDYEKARDAKIRLAEAIAAKNKYEDQIAKEKARYQSHANLVKNAYDEYTRKDYNYKPSYEYEEDASKNDAVEKFLAAHPFLDNRYDNPNYSPKLSNLSREIEETLKDKYRIEGRGNDINSHSFFQDLSNNLKIHLKNQFNTNLPTSNQNNMQPQGFGDGMNINRFSQDFTAPVTPTSNSRIKYSAPMNETQKSVRQSFVQTLKNAGINQDNIAESYDQIFNTYKQSY